MQRRRLSSHHHAPANPTMVLSSSWPRALAFGVLAVLSVAVSTPLGLVAQTPAPEEVFRFVEITDGVWAAEVLERPAAYAFANSLVVEGEDGVLVVDTQQSSAAARALITEIRRRTDAPVRWVVNTHWHGDHVYGNQAYREVWPGVVFLAHEATRAGMEAEGRAQLLAELSELPPSIEEREEWLSTSRGPDGDPLTADDRSDLQRSLALRRAQLEELRALRWTPPDVTFDRSATVHVGGDRRVELHYLGPAHTAGDVVVYLPAERVLAVGDLLEEGPPWLAGSDLLGWTEALERIDSFEVGALLPSHGTLRRDPGLLRWQADFLRTLIEEARRVASTSGDAQDVVATGAFERFRDDFASVGVTGQRLDAYLLEAAGIALAAVGG